MKTSLLFTIISTLVISATSAFADVAVYDGQRTRNDVITGSWGSSKVIARERIIRIVDLTEGKTRVAEVYFFSQGTYHYFSNPYVYEMEYFHIGDQTTGKRTILSLSSSSEDAEYRFHNSILIQGPDRLVNIAQNKSVELAKSLKGHNSFRQHRKENAGGYDRVLEQSEALRLDLNLTRQYNDENLTLEQAMDSMRLKLGAEGYMQDH